MLRVHTFAELVRQARTRYGTRPFYVGDEFLGTVTYADVLRFCIGFERDLEARGILPGAAVASVFKNCASATLVFLAVMAAGRVYVPLDPALPEHRMKYCLDKADCSVVLIDPAHTRARDYGRRAVIPVSDHQQYFRRTCSDREDFVGLPASLQLGVPVGEVVFSADTQPIGTFLAEDSLLADATALAVVFELGSFDRFLTVLPLFRAAGQVFTTLACALTGGWTVAVDTQEAAANFRAGVQKYRPGWSFCTAPLLRDVLQNSTASASWVAPMRGLLVSGLQTQSNVSGEFEQRFGIPVYAAYGSEETSSIATCDSPDKRCRVPGSVGTALPGCRIRIDPRREITDGRNSRGRTEVGDILISGANIFERYVDDVGLTLQKKRDGWFRTGDTGYLDKHGNLFVMRENSAMPCYGCNGAGSSGGRRVSGYRHRAQAVPFQD